MRRVVRKWRSGALGLVVLASLLVAWTASAESTPVSVSSWEGGRVTVFHEWRGQLLAGTERPASILRWLGSEWEPAWGGGWPDAAVLDLAEHDGSLFAALGGGRGILTSSDATVWSTAHADAGPEHLDHTSLAVHGGALYAGTHSGALVERLSTSGLWEAVTRLPAASVADLASFGGRLYAAASGGALPGVYSLAGGAWSRVLPLPQSATATLLADEAELWLRTSDGPGLYRTVDGDAWVPEALPPGASPALGGALALRGGALLGTSGDAVYERTAGGAWEEVFLAPEAEPLASLAVFGGEVVAGSALRGRVFHLRPAPPESPVAASPLLLAGLGLAVGSVASTGLVWKSPRYTPLAFLVPLYTRLRGEQVLANFTRGAIYGHVRTRPGTSFTEIGETLDLPNGTLTYHLAVLEREALVSSQRDGVKKRFYPTGYVGLVRGSVLSEAQRRILRLLAEAPGLTQTAIGRRLALSKWRVHYHVRRLERLELLGIEPRGRETLCRLTGTHRNTADGGLQIITESRTKEWII